jgi:hypothetical protein
VEGVIDASDLPLTEHAIADVRNTVLHHAARHANNLSATAGVRAAHSEVR